MPSYDVIIVGGGLVGVSTLFHLAELGTEQSLLVERNSLGGGGTGRSCAIIRTHYSIPSNTELAVASLRMFRDLGAVLDDREADSGFVNSGYLILAPAGETARALRENLARQCQHGANTYEVSEREAIELHPLLHVSDVEVIGYEPDSGYADPHLTTMSFARAARMRGAEIRSNAFVKSIIIESDQVRGVRTPSEDIYADKVICVVGPWTGDLLAPIGLDVPLKNYRHTVITLGGSEYRRDLPIVKDLTVENKMYFRPDSGMILVGTGDYGVPVASPDDLDVELDEDLVIVQMRQIAHRVPSFADAGIVHSWYGPYDVTPDWNPIIDQAPGVDGLYIAFGFSGHGFKLAPMVGRLLAQMSMGEEPEIDATPYRYTRFAEGEQLVGAYGIGSIS